MPKAKAPSVVTELPPETPATSRSCDLIREHLERAKVSGIARSDIAAALGFKENNLSNFATGKHLVPLCRTLALASAMRLSDSQTFELVNARLHELHGQNTDLCLNTVAFWALHLVLPSRGSDETFVDQALAEAKVPASHLDGVLRSKDIRDHVRRVLYNAVQEELARSARS